MKVFPIHANNVLLRRSRRRRMLYCPNASYIPELICSYPFTSSLPYPDCCRFASAPCAHMSVCPAPLISQITAISKPQVQSISMPWEQMIFFPSSFVSRNSADLKTKIIPALLRALQHGQLDGHNYSIVVSCGSAYPSAGQDRWVFFDRCPFDNTVRISSWESGREWRGQSFV